MMNLKTERMLRNNFTNHGLHLTNMGKNNLINRLAELTKEITGFKGVNLNSNGGREEKKQVKPTFLEIWLGLKSSK